VSAGSAAGWRRRAGLTLRLWRCVPLAAALATAGLMARRRTPTSPEPHVSGEAPGLSVIVPERGTPDLLEETLAALAQALKQVDEPAQVVIIVNGAEQTNYAALCTKYQNFDWHFHPRALGYNAAIDAGLHHARYAWTYLLNSDMRLAPDALREVLAQRRPWVFAIASQIFFADPSKRREETGWSDFHANPQTPEVYERDPGPDARLVRGSLYAGGGSALFRSDVLRGFVRGSVDYQPFYWEDADWGVRAWVEGWEVLFCPTSHAWHHHRGTVRRYYEANEVERVIARNALLFDLRHAWTQRRAATLLRAVALTDARSRSELSGIGTAWRIFRARLATLRARQRGLRFESVTLDRWYDRARQIAKAPRRPRVLLVSPFALFPPAHGGARRVAELVARLRDRIDFILLGDEGSLYGAAAEPWFKDLLAARLIEGRGDRAGETLPPLAQRLVRHAWPGLRAELDRLIARYDPDIVQVEFMELAALADARHGRARWLLALHDVYLSGKAADGANDDEQRAAMKRFDALSACSTEDAALLPSELPATLIGNGAIDRRNEYIPSASTPPRLLFMGPFRYAQNRDGILEFIDRAWPALRAHFPDLALTILGGVESAVVARTDARLRQPGVELIAEFVDPAPHLAKCTLTINPQRNIRGSSIKLIESLLAGRVCVSTADGARGFTDAGLQGLVLAADIAAMTVPILAMLAGDVDRHQRERADPARLDTFTWEAMAQRQLDLYRTLIDGGIAP
jgi:O-antigen biosynthesis protein